MNALSLNLLFGTQAVKNETETYLFLGDVNIQMSAVRG